MVTDFAGKVALVTGGASGIGAATCLLLGERGATVYVGDRDRPNAERVAKTLPNGSVVVLDVANSDEVNRAIDGVIAECGRLDVVIHCAGVDDPEVKAQIAEQRERNEPVDVTRTMTDATWRRMLSINLDGVFFVVRACLAHMAERGAGAIVVIGSDAGIDGVAGYPHYSAAKGGAHALIRAVAKEALGHGVRVNAIAPGPVDTPMLNRTPAAISRERSSIRVGRPEEIASVAVFLASDSASYISGETVIATGGRLTV